MSWPRPSSLRAGAVRRCGSHCSGFAALLERAAGRCAVAATRSAAPILRAGAVRLVGTRCLSGRRDGGHAIAANGRLQPVVLNSAKPGRTRDELAAPILPPRWRRAPLWSELAASCLSGRRAIAPQHRHPKPSPSSLRAGAVRRCGCSCWTASRCLSGRRAIVPQHPPVEPRPSSLRAGAARHCGHTQPALVERAAGKGRR